MCPLECLHSLELDLMQSGVTFVEGNVLVTQGNSPVTTTRVGTVMLVDQLDCWNTEKGEELKVPHHASAAATRDGNLPHIMTTCFCSQQNDL